MKEPDFETILMMQINDALNRGIQIEINKQSIVRVGRFTALNTEGEYIPFDILELARTLRKQKVI